LNRALGLKTELTGSTWTNESNVSGSKLIETLFFLHQLIETLGWHDDADASETAFGFYPLIFYIFIHLSTSLSMKLALVCLFVQEYKIYFSLLPFGVLNIIY
jgi:hypothetical protein